MKNTNGKRSLVLITICLLFISPFTYAAGCDSDKYKKNTFKPDADLPIGYAQWANSWSGWWGSECTYFTVTKIKRNNKARIWLAVSKKSTKATAKFNEELDQLTFKWGQNQFKVRLNNETSINIVEKTSNGETNATYLHVQ